MNKTTAAYQDQHAYWNEDREPELLAVSVILIVVTSLAIAIRLWAQCTIKKQRAHDNLVIVVAAALAIGVTIACVIAFTNGVGKHIVRVTATDSDKPRKMIRSGYVIGLLQGPCLGLVKVSILLFYRRIFTMHRRTFKIAFYVLGTYSLLLTIATLVVFILQCLPVTFFWNRAYLLEKVKPPYPLQGHCLPQQLHVVTILIANTISDVAVLVLPGIGLWNLRLPRGKKVGLFGVFSLGAFVVGVGVVRIYYGFKATNTADLTWVNANIMLWTAVECCIGTICASLPAMAPLLKRSDNTPGRMSTIWSRLIVSKIPKPWLPFRHRWSHARDGSSDEDGSSLRNLRPTGDVSGTFAKEVV
ncbi:MAG: hypothetical protein L6R42_002758 [Xanthoria sp. 1 TBL-2021]|nr:MAG: hypothetical protein L6R42_002758 [Xanthoria sp. 1 TBL-2021]